MSASWKKWREVKTDEIKSKGTHYIGLAGDDVWFGVLGTKEEGRKKVK